MKTIYKQVAVMYGVTPKEVKKEIEHALSFAKQNPSTFQKNAPSTAEETILHLAAEVSHLLQSK